MSSREYINYRYDADRRRVLRSVATVNPWASMRANLRKVNQNLETPADVELSQAPFFYMAQYENAVSVWTISFETMLQLA